MRLFSPNLTVVIMAKAPSRRARRVSVKACLLRSDSVVSCLLAEPLRWDVIDGRRVAGDVQKPDETNGEPIEQDSSGCGAKGIGTRSRLNSVFDISCQQAAASLAFQ